MTSDPITAFGLFVLRLVRRPVDTAPSIRPIPLSATTDEMAELRRVLLRQIERDEVRNG